MTAVRAIDGTVADVLASLSVVLFCLHMSFVFADREIGLQETVCGGFRCGRNYGPIALA